VITGSLRLQAFQASAPCWSIFRLSGLAIVDVSSVSWTATRLARLQRQPTMNQIYLSDVLYLEREVAWVCL
jgi:hypothetical protein